MSHTLYIGFESGESETEGTLSLSGEVSVNAKWVFPKRGDKTLIGKVHECTHVVVIQEVTVYASGTAPSVDTDLDAQVPPDGPERLSSKRLYQVFEVSDGRISFSLSPHASVTYPAGETKPQRVQLNYSYRLVPLFLRLEGALPIEVESGDFITESRREILVGQNLDARFQMTRQGIGEETVIDIEWVNLPEANLFKDYIAQAGGVGEVKRLEQSDMNPSPGVTDPLQAYFVSSGDIQEEIRLKVTFSLKEEEEPEGGDPPSGPGLVPTELEWKEGSECELVQDISVDVPRLATNASPRYGDGGIVKGLTNGGYSTEGSFSIIQLLDASGQERTSHPGEGFWTANHVITPDKFVLTQGSNTTGLFYYTQLIDRYYLPYIRRNNADQEVPAEGYARFQLELDNWVQYQVVVGMHPALSARSMTDLIMVDSPSVRAQRQNHEYYSRIDWTDRFEAFIMYVPPGANVKPVPIAVYEWGFTAQLNKTWTGYHITTIEPSYVRGPNDSDSHPVWSSTFINGFNPPRRRIR
ncbi:MAG: hypothetical protein ACK4P3_01955 [Fimbriimonadaceae bacterium]